MIMGIKWGELANLIEKETPVDEQVEAVTNKFISFFIASDYHDFVITGCYPAPASRV